MPSVFLGLVRQAASIIAATAEDRARFAVLNYEISLLKSSLLSDRAERNRLQSIPSDPQQQAWCADFTESLEGEVATVEVPAEGVVGQFLTWRRVIIRPGYDGRATYSAPRDGQMFHREGQFGYQAYFNAAILPGVQRWRPQYRIGVINAINTGAHTCTLTIQGEDSSAQSLIIDPPDLQYTKTGVPIEYMDCHSAVFQVGDRVLVEFQGRNWNSPKVIGFESHPRPCEELRIFEIFIGFQRNLAQELPPDFGLTECTSEQVSQYSTVYYRDVDFIVYTNPEFWAYANPIWDDPDLRPSNCEVNISNPANSYQGLCFSKSTHEIPDRGLVGEEMLPGQTLPGLVELGLDFPSWEVTAELISPLTDAGMNLHGGVRATFNARPLTGTCRLPSGATPVLITGEPQYHDEVDFMLADIPDIHWQDLEWEPIGFTRLDAQANNHQPHMHYPARVVCRRKDPA